MKWNGFIKCIITSFTKVEKNLVILFEYNFEDYSGNLLGKSV